MLFITSKVFFTLFLLCFSCRQNRRQLFPSRTEHECLTELRKHPRSYFAYQNMTQEWKNRFLEFMEGTKTLPLTYDPFFKKLFNPDIYPSRAGGWFDRKCGDPEDSIHRLFFRCVVYRRISIPVGNRSALHICRRGIVYTGVRQIKQEVLTGLSCKRQILSAISAFELKL